MQKPEKNVTKFHTRGAAFPGKIEAVIQRSSGEIINAIIMTFPIIVDDK